MYDDPAGLLYALIGTSSSNVIFKETDLKRILDCVRPAAPLWKDIGLNLGFTKSDLDLIQAKPLLLLEGPEGYLRELLGNWLQWAPPNHSLPALEALASAVRRTGKERVAYDLVREFLGQEGT